MYNLLGKIKLVISKVVNFKLNRPIHYEAFKPSASKGPFHYEDQEMLINAVRNCNIEKIKELLKIRVMEYTEDEIQGFTIFFDDLTIKHCCYRIIPDVNYSINDRTALDEAFFAYRLRIRGYDERIFLKIYYMLKEANVKSTYFQIDDIENEIYNIEKSKDTYEDLIMREQNYNNEPITFI